MKTNNDLKSEILDLLNLPASLVTCFSIFSGRTTVMVVEATYATSDSRFNDMRYTTGRWEWIDGQGWKEL